MYKIEECEFGENSFATDDKKIKFTLVLFEALRLFRKDLKHFMSESTQERVNMEVRQDDEGGKNQA